MFNFLFCQEKCSTLIINWHDHNWAKIPNTHESVVSEVELLCRSRNEQRLCLCLVNLPRSAFSSHDSTMLRTNNNNKRGVLNHFKTLVTNSRVYIYTLTLPTLSSIFWFMHFIEHLVIIIYISF
jgi:hypothetical protein